MHATTTRPTFSDICRERIAQLKEVDWLSPKVILGGSVLILLPMAGGYYMGVGIFTGLTLSLSILLVVDKFPKWLKKKISQYPLLSDIVLSSLAVGTVGKLFGGGLILGIGGLVCAAVLSVALHYVNRG